MLKTNIFAIFAAQLAAIPRTHQSHDACLLPSVLQTIHSRYEHSAKTPYFLETNDLHLGLDESETQNKICLCELVARTMHCDIMHRKRDSSNAQTHFPFV